MAGQKHNIAVFTSTWLGVSETFIFRQLMAIKDNEFNNIVLTQRFKDSELKKGYSGKVYYKKMNKRSFYLGILTRKLNWGRNGWFASKGQKNVWRNGLIENQIKLIHAHYGPNGLKILRNAEELNIPLVTTFHGNDASAMLNNKAYLKSLKALFNYSYIITVSEFLKRRLISLGADENKIVRHYIGTDLDKFKFSRRLSVHEKAKKNKQLRLLQVSNFVEKKGHKYTIKAFKEFLTIYPNAKLILAGDGKTRKEMEALVSQLNIKGNVSFFGAVPPQTVASLMKEADLFVHHSVTGSDGSEEGIPTVLMEAMASGVPVVSSRHAGIPELIASGCGFLVEEKNISEYKDVLFSILRMNTMVIADRAKKRVYELFDVKKQNRKLIDIYSNIIENGTLH